MQRHPLRSTGHQLTVCASSPRGPAKGRGSQERAGRAAPYRLSHSQGLAPPPLPPEGLVHRRLHAPQTLRPLAVDDKKLLLAGTKGVKTASGARTSQLSQRAAHNFTHRAKANRACLVHLGRALRTNTEEEACISRPLLTPFDMDTKRPERPGQKGKGGTRRNRVDSRGHGARGACMLHSETC